MSAAFHPSMVKQPQNSIEAVTPMTIFAPNGVAATPTPIEVKDSNLSSLDDIRSAAKSGRLSCEIGNCNPAVVMVSVVTEAGLERCSGFLISGTEVMTNDHCINQSAILKGWETRTQGLPCKSFVYIHFAGDGDQAKEQTLDCDSIETRSGEQGIATEDYAIIKLSSVIADRHPLKLSSRGFKNHETADLIRVQMSSDGTQTGFGGFQSHLHCEASYATYLFPNLNSSQSAFMTFGDCEVQAGNSGSPILNADGEVGAMNQGFLNPPADASVAASLKSEDLDQAFGTIAVGMQLSCIAPVNPESSKSCMAPTLPMSLSTPQDFVENGTPFDLASLPKSNEGESWVQTSSSTETELVFISAPPCLSDHSFSTQILRYKKGLNSLMQTTWELELENSSAPISMMDGSTQGSFSNSEAGSVSIPACQS